MEQERGVVLTERARIARELHDVVAHHMSLIAVRAESAPYRVGEVSDAARGEFAEISAAARTALTPRCSERWRLAEFEGDDRRRNSLTNRFGLADVVLPSRTQPVVVAVGQAAAKPFAMVFQLVMMRT